MAPSANGSSAEFIVERPKKILTNGQLELTKLARFDRPIQFLECTVWTKDGQVIRLNNIPHEKITMIKTKTDQTPLAEVSDVDQSNASFTVEWKGSGL